MDFEFPTLVNPADKEPYALVAEHKDILNSKLLTPRDISLGAHEGSGKPHLVVIKDFLQDLTKKSPVAYTPDSESQQLVNDYKSKKQNYDQRVQDQVHNLQNLSQKLMTGYETTCNKLVNQLVQSVNGETNTVDKALDSLKAVLASDPEQEASIPKPNEIVNKITELRAAPELPDYLFQTTKKVRAWRNAPQELCVWNKTKEEFYRNNLEQTLSQQVVDKSELAIKFLNQQIDKLGEQLLNIIQEDSSLTQRKFVNLNIETAEAFALLLNTMITPETRIVLHIGDFTTAESKSIAESFERLTNIVNLQVNWNVNNKAQGLDHIAQAIGSASQLQTLTFQFSSNVVAAKDFFSSFKDVKLTNLSEVTVNASQSVINSSVQYVAKALKAVGGSQVRSVVLNFSQAQVDQKAAQQLGDALSAYKGVKRLVLNFSGYSLLSNKIQDDGFNSLIENVTNFSETLVELTINVGRNSLTDASLSGLNKTFSTTKWAALKTVHVSFQYNKITEKGARKLGKFLSSLPILVNLELNLNSTEVNYKGLSFLVNQLGPQVNASILVKQSNVTKEEAADLVGKVASLSI